MLDNQIISFWLSSLHVYFLRPTIKAYRMKHSQQSHSCRSLRMVPETESSCTEYERMLSFITVISKNLDAMIMVLIFYICVIDEIFIVSEKLQSFNLLSEIYKINENQ